MTGVIVGRFQSPYIHEGHDYLIRKALEETGNVLIVVGVSPVRLTEKNPLPPYEVYGSLTQKYIKEMMSNKIRVTSLYDHKRDEVWSLELDKLLPDDAILYGSRDSFIKYYSGKFPCKEIEPNVEISSTQLRLDAYKDVRSHEDFRRGYIEASKYKFPTAYPCVDIIMYDTNNNILLAKKPGYDKYHLVGGFVDPTDESLEKAAEREFREEVLNLPTNLITDFEYVTSMKINDWRYRGTKDGIISSLFSICLIDTFIEYKDKLKAGDDIEEVKWFNIDEINEQIVSSNHFHFVSTFINKLKKQLNDEKEHYS